jgi:CBS domain containing-hemolysin-like protein
MDEEQSDLFKSALDFSETTVKDVMTMRADISGIDISMPNNEILSFIRSSNHSRLVVYSGDLDNVIGILQIRLFIKEYLKSHDFDVRSILSEPFFVSPDENIDALLTKMRQQKNYIAVVASDEKKTYGLVTIEDFLEELVGEIWDEDDVVDNDFVKLGGNKFSIDTRLAVKDAFSKMGVEYDDSPAFSRPIISWIIETFGHFPEEEESFDYKNLLISVEEIKDHRITRITVKINSDIDEQDSAPLKEEISNE